MVHVHAVGRDQCLNNLGYLLGSLQEAFMEAPGLVKRQGSMHCTSGTRQVCKACLQHFHTSNFQNLHQGVKGEELEFFSGNF